MRWLRIIAVIAVVIFLVLIGFLFRNYPYVQWKKEVTIAEVANFCVTLGVGVVIPLVILRISDTSRNRKNLLGDECKDVLATVRKIKDRFDQCYVAGNVTNDDKTVIVFLFDDADTKIYNLFTYLEQVFDSKGLSIHADIQSAYGDYQQVVTGGPLMATNFTVIDRQFHTDQNAKWSAFEQKLKAAQIAIQGL